MSRARIALVAIIATILCAPGTAARAQAPAGESADPVITLADQDTATAGDTRALALEIAPSPGLSISPDGPLTVELDVTPPQGITLPRRRYDHRHATGTRATSPRFDLTYRAVDPGHYTMTVDIRFWVCGERTCWPVSATRRVQLRVTAPPDAPPAARPEGATGP